MHRLSRTICTAALIVIAGMIAPAAPVPKNIDPPSFEAKSVIYVDAEGKSQTENFNKNRIVQFARAGVNSEIVISGTVSPANAKVGGKLVIGEKKSDQTEYDVVVKNTEWQVKVPAHTFRHATTYYVEAVDGAMTVNGTSVSFAKMYIGVAGR